MGPHVNGLRGTPDLRCACPGADTRYVQCEEQADAEDGLCSGCRARDCPNTPLRWYLERMDDAFKLPVDQREAAMDGVRDEYIRRCQEQGEQP
jgi:hypothetical protein